MADLGPNTSKSVISDKGPGRPVTAGNTDKSFKGETKPRADKFAYKRKGPKPAPSGKFTE